MQLRVVTDQPWNVPADVLVLPFVGDPVFEGELAEIDRRAGGELHVLAAFRELRTERYETALSSAGQLPVGRLLAIAAGPAAALDRETAVRLGAAIQRRLAGRPVRRLAVWLGAVAASLEGGTEAAAELVTRGIVEGSYDPAALYGTGDAVVEAGPPAVEELILIVPAGSSAVEATRAAERGVVVGEGTNLTRRLANRSANDVTPQVLADEARSLAAAHGLA
ncbi:MAG TPA: M17 family peptidase N-terminal domain-containing protein, partial [Verrucomicrobiae bacterium]|nr:M17 family peptidase N-terminal domain-containing protein [Verrucomicrobiae bacterium]